MDQGKTPSLEKDTIIKRLNGVQGELVELRTLAKLSPLEFRSGVPFKLAQFHMHRILEGIFHITAHVLSRIPGAQATSYTEMARGLGEHGIVSKEYAETTLVKMAKYRNRLVHFYANISEEEMYEILQSNLEDVEIFLTSIKNLLESPEKFGLSVD